MTPPECPSALRPALQALSKAIRNYVDAVDELHAAHTTSTTAELMAMSKRAGSRLGSARKVRDEFLEACRSQFELS